MNPSPTHGSESALSVPEPVSDIQATSPAGDDLTDDQLLDGLWWGDPEWPAWCDGIWREYVDRMHEFNHYRSAVATLLRSATPKEATNG